MRFPSKVENILEQIKLDWPSKLHILADFDRTLTKGFYQWKKISSIASFLYTWDYLCSAYQEQWQALFDHYYPIEQDHSMDRAVKKKAMQERWTKHLDILIKYKLSRNDIADIVQQDSLQLRDGYTQFFVQINTHQIPLIIISASGIGYDAIDVFFRHKKINQQYISIISNAFIRDEKWYAIGRKEPIIHSLNKKETTLQQFPAVYAKVKDRTNVILLGDSLHDLEMIDGFDYDNLLTIWRCHSNDPVTKKRYDEHFDIVITDDGPLDVVNDILQNFR